MSEQEQDAESHLNPEVVARYRAGTLASLDELLAVETHLERCARCRLWLGTQIAGGGNTLFHVILSSASDDLLPCPDAELLARYAEGQADAVDAELVAAHLEGCAVCYEAAALARAQSQSGSSSAAAARPAWRDTLDAMLTARFAWPQREMLRLSVQRGAENATPAAIALLRPVRTVVMSERPLLECALPERGEKGQAFVYNVATYEACDTIALSAVTWQTRDPLARGQVYEWYVSAERAGDTIESAVVRFQVADIQTAADLADIIAADDITSLGVSVLYAQHGLFDDALAELTRWQQEHPTDADADALLRVLTQIKLQV